MNAAKEAKAGNMNVRDDFILEKWVLHFYQQERLAHKNVYTDVCLNCGYGKFSLQHYLSILANKRVRVAKTKQELDELDDESTDIFKFNIIERYCIRPASIPAVDNLSLAQFAAYY